MNTIERIITTMDPRMLEVEKSAQFQSNMVEEQKSKSLEFSKYGNVSKPNRYHSQSKQRNCNITAQAQDILEPQARSMRENLLFFCIHEERHEKKILDLCENSQRIEQTNENITRAHRRGRRNTGIDSRPQPIVVKFERFNEKEEVRKKGGQLKSQGSI